MSAKVAYFPGVSANNIPPSVRRREPAEVGLAWLVEHKPGAVTVIGDLIIDLIGDERARVSDPKLAAQLRRQHQERFPEWDGA
jgi:hypothetical protein